MRCLSRLWKVHPQRLLSRLYVCREFSVDTIFRQPLPSHNFAHQAWSRYFSCSSHDGIESFTIDIDDAELMETGSEPDDGDHLRLQLEIANDDPLLKELQQCQSLEEVRY